MVCAEQRGTLLNSTPGSGSHSNGAKPAPLATMGIMRNTRCHQHRQHSEPRGVVRGIMLIVLACAVPAPGWTNGAPREKVTEERVQDLRSRPDFSGNWEMDYARSDRWDDELHRTVNQVQREALLRHQRGDGGPWVLGNARRQARAIMAKARLADMVTRQGAFHITQTSDQVRIDRVDDAPLICSTDPKRQETFSSSHGHESCAWDRRQLLFEIALPQGVTIQHRFSLDPGGDGLSVLTRVSSSDAPPFDLRQFYVRFEEAEASFQCLQTLSQGRVCSTEEQADEVMR